MAFTTDCRMRCNNIACGINSFHNKLKRNPAYFGSMANRRVDQLLSVLLKMEKDQFMDVKKKELWPTAGTVQKQQNMSHEKAMLITDDDIAPVKNMYCTNTQHTLEFIWTCSVG